MKWARALTVLILAVLLLQPATLKASHQHTRVEVNIWLHGAPEIQPIKDLETLVGVKFNGAKWYQNWDDQWRPWIPTGYHSNGYTPEMSWQPMLKQLDGSYVGVANSDIVAGVYDSYLDTISGQIKALPFRLRISFGNEFNGGWNPWGLGRVGNTVENHKAAWRYVVDRFRLNGLTNVDWIWTPNVDPFNQTPSFASMYPGDDYVTYLGLDGYNFSTTNGPYWMSFDQVFLSSYKQLQAISAKDIYLIEVGSVEVGGDKAAWIKDMFDKLETSYTQIKGITWWNVAYPEYDMRIETSVASRLQFARSVNGEAVSSPPPANGSAVQQKETTPLAKNVPTKAEDPALPVIAPNDTGFSLPAVIRQLTPDRSTTIVGTSALLLFLLTVIFFAITRRALKVEKTSRDS
jgi:hypothetical protein